MHRTAVAFLLRHARPVSSRLVGRRVVGDLDSCVLRARVYRVGARVRSTGAGVLSVGVLVVGVLGGCGLLGEESATDGPVVSEAGRALDGSTVHPSTGPASGSATDADSSVGCPSFAAEVTGTVAQSDLTETSGLVRASSDPNLLWAVNDSGNEPGLFAVGLDGTDHGFYPLVDEAGRPVAAVDIEDLGRLDNTIYVADIGDNDSVRDSVTVLVVDEPDPSVSGTAVVRQRIRLRYPNGPGDAEAFFVDPLTGQLVILGKDRWGTATPIFTANPPFGPEAEVVLTELGALDLSALQSSSSNLPLAGVLFPHAATAADVDRTGATVAVRTYSTVWLFPRSLGDGDGEADSIVEAFTNEPCEGASALEAQGEALAIVAPLQFPGGEDGGADGQGGAYVTISEGIDQPVNLFSR